MSERSEKRHNDLGEEILDDTVRQPPLNYKKTVPLHVQIAQQVRREIMLRDEAIAETEDEADDFEIGDDYEPLSKYENDHIPSIKVLKAKAKEINDQIKEAQRKKAIADHEAALGRAPTAAGESQPAARGSVVNPGADPSPSTGSA